MTSSYNSFESPPVKEDTCPNKPNLSSSNALADQDVDVLTVHGLSSTELRIKLNYTVTVSPLDSIRPQVFQAAETGSKKLQSTLQELKDVLKASKGPNNSPDTAIAAISKLRAINTELRDLLNLIQTKRLDVLNAIDEEIKNIRSYYNLQSYSSHAFPFDSNSSVQHPLQDSINTNNEYNFDRTSSQSPHWSPRSNSTTGELLCLSNMSRYDIPETSSFHGTSRHTITSSMLLT